MGCLLTWPRASHKTRIRFSSFCTCSPTLFNKCGIGKEKQMRGQTIFGKSARTKLNSACLFWVWENVEKKIEFAHTKPWTHFLKLLLVYPLWANDMLFRGALSWSVLPLFKSRAGQGRLGEHIKGCQVTADRAWEFGFRIILCLRMISSPHNELLCFEGTMANI